MKHQQYLIMEAFLMEQEDSRQQANKDEELQQTAPSDSSTIAKAPPVQPKLDFLDLPPEIRRMVYRIHLRYPKQPARFLRKHRHGKRTIEYLEGWEEVLDLLEASPQMMTNGEEACIYDSYFEVNTVYAGIDVNFEAFMAWFTPRQRQATRHLKFEVLFSRGITEGLDRSRRRRESERWKLLQQCRSLSSLEFEFPWCRWRRQEDLPWMVGIEALLLHARGLKRVEFAYTSHDFDERQKGNIRFKDPRTEWIREALTKPWARAEE